MINRPAAHGNPDSPDAQSQQTQPPQRARLAALLSRAQPRSSFRHSTRPSITPPISAAKRAPPKRSRLAAALQRDCWNAAVVAWAEVMDDRTKEIIAATVARMPEWIRHDLVAKDAAIRARAEETLVAMIAGALHPEAEAED